MSVSITVAVFPYWKVSMCKSVKGEFIGLGGRNGCGKTTVTRLLMGLEKPVSGEILYNGKVINDDDASIRSHFIGYVFQRPERQMFRPTVREEVAYGPKQLGMSEAQIQAAVDEALKATQLTDLAESYPPNLNRGEKQRVAIASAIAMHTQYIILDEPTSGQDSEDKEQLMELLSELHQKGMTILIISHDMDILPNTVSGSSSSAIIPRPLTGRRKNCLPSAMIYMI